jgi:hypothetical protein
MRSEWPNVLAWIIGLAVAWCVWWVMTAIWRGSVIVENVALVLALLVLAGILRAWHLLNERR